jgi:hypothetical protein
MKGTIRQFICELVLLLVASYAMFVLLGAM